jgi:FkbM family methyltransferase
MLISAQRLHAVWGLDPKVLVHIGAHEAEELADYQRLGWGSRRTIWVEALPDKAEKVRGLIAGLPNHSVVNAVFWDHSGEQINFQETSNGQSSSALKLKDHSDVYSNITVKKVWSFTTTTAAETLPFDELETVDLLNIDIQGAELRALQGFGPELDRVNAIYSEVNLRELYSGVALFDELDEWLSSKGFVLVDSELLPAVGWGDALWLRDSVVPPRPKARRLRRRFLDVPRRLKFALGTRWQRLTDRPRSS